MSDTAHHRDRYAHQVRCPRCGHHHQAEPPRPREYHLRPRSAVRIELQRLAGFDTRQAVLLYA